MQELAERDGISIDQFISTTVAEKIAASIDRDLEELSQRGSRAKYDAVLAKVPDVEPEPCDQLPPE
ncbi:hypothetical protein [Phormidesmis sp. 146-20]